MVGGNSTPQVVDRTIYQDGYGGSIWPVATLRLKLWTGPYSKMVMVDQYGRWQLYASSCGQDHISRLLWWINIAGGNSTPQVVDKTIFQDGYGGSIWPVATPRLKLLTGLWIPWWIWWPMINNLVQILRTFLSC